MLWSEVELEFKRECYGQMLSWNLKRMLWSEAELEFKKECYGQRLS
jgi:hypothetical protein